MAVSTLAGNGAASFGSVVTVAGNLEPGYVDAVGIHPYHVAMHPSGNFILVADYSNRQIGSMATDT